MKLNEQFYYLGILDLIIIDISNNLTIYGYNKFQKRAIQIQSQEQLFPDKLRYLRGYSYKLYFFDNPLEVSKVNGEYHGARLYIFNELLRRQHAQYHFEKFIPLARRYEGYNDSYIAETRIYDFAPNLRLVWDLEQPIHPILSYHTTKYCAIIPKEPERTILSYIVSPFDAATWILMVISLALGSIIWVLVQKKQKERSATQFVLAVYGMFFSQDIQMTHLNRPQKYLYQHYAIAFFILGLFYESLIVSLIFTNRNAQEIRSFEELRNSEFPEILAYENYIVSLESSGSHHQFLKRLKGYTVVDIEAGLLAKKKPIIYTCSLQWKFEDLDISDYYELKDKEFPNYFYFLTWYQNPLIERIQDHFSRIFEAGIQRILERKYLELRVGKIGNHATRQRGHFYLEFDDLFGLHNILICGFSVASIVFFFELVCYFGRRFLSRKFRKKIC